MKNNKKDEINALAEDYYNAKVVKSNDEKRLYKELLFLVYIAFSKIIFEDKTDPEIYDKAIDYSIDTFDPHHGKSFTSYLYMNTKYKGLDIIKKNKRIIQDSDGKSIENLPDEEDVSDNFEKEFKIEEVRKRLPYVVIKFYSHNKGKSASEVRLSYFRIFVTENIMEIIIESNNIDGFNNDEAYECTDKEFVRFITVLDYLSLQDLKDLNKPNQFKKISDIFPEDKKSSDNPVKVPCENRVIAEYRYASKLDASRTSDSNVSQQRKHYKKALAVLFEDLK